MTYARPILAAALAAVLAAPAFAQTAQPAPAVQTSPADTAPTPPTDPAAPVQSPVPDTGIKKTAPTHVHHRVHHRGRVKAPDTATPPAATQR